MSQVLYARYNSTRRPDFRVTTEVCEDVNGLFVRKRAGEDAARAHLENIYRNGLCLRDYYEDIRVASAEWSEGALRIPYIRGKTLAEGIDPDSFEKDRLVARVNEGLERVLRIQERFVAPFRSSPEFEAMFGKVALGPDVTAVNPANIDSLLTNFIGNETGLYCIDCEWVCQFPVPVDYIRYRALRYLYLNQLQPHLGGIALEEMLGWFGFSPEALAAFWKMEKSFQQYVHGRAWAYIYPERYRKSSLSFDKVGFIWRLTKPVRKLAGGIRRIARPNTAVSGVLRMTRAALKHGPGYALRNRRLFF